MDTALGTLLLKCGPLLRSLGWAGGERLSPGWTDRSTGGGTWSDHSAGGDIAWVERTDTETSWT